MEPVTEEASRIAAMVDRMNDKDRYFIYMLCKIVLQDYTGKKEETK